MTDVVADFQTDRRPGILICGYDGAAPANLDLVIGARTFAILPDEPEKLAAVLSDRLRDGDGQALLLIGRTTATDFRIQMRAENRRLTGSERIFTTAPSSARATAPVADMVRALQDEGLSAAASSEAEEDAGNYILYRVLAALPEDGDAPAIGLLRAPAAAEASLIQRGVQAAAGAIARRLSPIPRAR